MSEQVITKYCPKCKQIKPLTEFNKNKSTKDRYQVYCKSCQYAADKKYKQSEKGRKRYCIYYRTYNRLPRVRNTINKCHAEYAKNHPERIAATNAVANAVRAGKIPRISTQICKYCGKPAMERHHWKGYAKKYRLDIIPLCSKCHKVAHELLLFN